VRSGVSPDPGGEPSRLRRSQGRGDRAQPPPRRRVRARGHPGQLASPPPRSRTTRCAAPWATSSDKRSGRPSPSGASC